jgi:hypothetical protein
VYPGAQKNAQGFSQRAIRANITPVELLDRDRVRSVLGPRLGDRFLQYATPTDEAEAQRMLVHIDEHLALMAPQPGCDQRRASALASRCKRLLIRYRESTPEARAAITAVVRYFLDTHDLDRDDEPCGFDDDVEVMNFVVDVLAPELGRVT